MSQLPVRLKVGGLKKVNANLRNIKKGVRNYGARIAAIRAVLQRIKRMNKR